MGTLPRPPPRRPDRKPGPPQRIGFVPAEVDQLLPPLFRLDANTFDRGFVVDETMDGVSPVDSGFTSSIRPRRYLLHVPEAVQLMLEDPANKERVPLVLVFHGMSRYRFPHAEVVVPLRKHTTHSNNTGGGVT